MVGGVLYTTAGTRRAVVALDAATGELRWVHGEPEGARGAAAPRQLSGRGVVVLDRRQGGADPLRHARLPPGRARRENRHARAVVRQRTAPSISKAAAVYGNRPADRSRSTGEIGLHATPAIARRRRASSARRSAKDTRRRRTTTPRASCRRSTCARASALWNFNTIPRPGEFGNDTWEDNSWAYNGNVGVWNQMAIDEELGLVVPAGRNADLRLLRRASARATTCSPRASSRVDLKTGKRKWHFQLVHHPLWNMDISSAPDPRGHHRRREGDQGRVDHGQAGDGLRVRSRDGQPVWPIEERPVPQGDVPGEKYSPTQPFPTKPPPYDHQGVTHDNLIDFTPELRAEAVKLMSRYKMGPIFTPPSVSKAEGPIASFRSSGGTNWPGGAYDPETQMLYVPSYTSLVPVGADAAAEQGVLGHPLRARQCA